MIAVVQEVTGGEHGWDTGSKDNDTGFGQETQLQYNAFDLFNSGDVAPLSLCPSSPLKALAPLQRIVEDGVSDSGNELVGALYRGQGHQLGVRAIQFAIVYDVAVGGGRRRGGGGRFGGCRTVEAKNDKRWGWDSH